VHGQRQRPRGRKGVLNQIFIDGRSRELDFRAPDGFAPADGRGLQRFCLLRIV